DGEHSPGASGAPCRVRGCPCHPCPALPGPRAPRGGNPGLTDLRGPCACPEHRRTARANLREGRVEGSPVVPLLTVLPGEVLAPAPGAAVRGSAPVTPASGEVAPGEPEGDTAALPPGGDRVGAELRVTPVTARACSHPRASGPDDDAYRLPGRDGRDDDVVTSPAPTSTADARCRGTTTAPARAASGLSPDLQVGGTVRDDESRV